MTDDPGLGDLLAGAAPMTPGLGALVARPDGRFALAFADGTEMLVEETENRRVASVALGAPPMAGRLRAYATLLSYNGLWRQTGGAWIGLDSPDGDLFLMAELRDERTPEDLARVLGNLATVGAGWTDFLAAASPDAGAEPSSLSPSLIRG